MHDNRHAAVANDDNNRFIRKYLIASAKFQSNIRVTKKYTVIDQNQPYRHLQARFSGWILFDFVAKSNKI